MPSEEQRQTQALQSISKEMKSLVSTVDALQKTLVEIGRIVKDMNEFPATEAALVSMRETYDKQVGEAMERDD